MKIKHFAGYGCVNAVKSRYTKFTDVFGRKCIQMTISVSGNHEWGLVREDKYDLYNWLVKRFDKSVSSYTEIIDYSVNDYYVGGVENCDYTFTYYKK